jgi:hypothetical protein
MAKKKKSGVNKSKAIRDYYDANPAAMPAEVAEAMKAQGIDVTPAFVSTVKSNAKKTGTPGRRGRPAGSTAKKAATKKKVAQKSTRAAAGKNKGGNEVSLDALINAKKLVDEMGGVENARSALSVLEQLM